MMAKIAIELHHARIKINFAIGVHYVLVAASVPSLTHLATSLVLMKQSSRPGVM